MRVVFDSKDVYVEKPNAYDIWESQKMVEAAKQYNRIVQVGTQNRSAPYNFTAAEYVKSGKLGKIGLVKVYNLKSGKEFRLGETEPIPAGFNWDIWLGSASLCEFPEMREGPKPAKRGHRDRAQCLRHGAHGQYRTSGRQRKPAIRRQVHAIFESPSSDELIERKYRKGYEPPERI